MGAIAEYENPGGLDGTNPDNLKKIMESSVIASSRFSKSKLIISVGDHPSVPERLRICKDQKALPGQLFVLAYTWQLPSYGDRYVWRLVSHTANRLFSWQNL